MVDVFEIGKELVPLVSTGSGADLRTLFFERASKFRSSLVSGEYGTVGLFSDLRKALTPEVAFGLIPVAFGLVGEVYNDNYRLECALLLVEELAEVSDTTEIDAESKSVLLALSRSPELKVYSITESVRRLMLWYRI